MEKKTLAAISIVILSGLIGATPFILDETSVKFQERSYNSSLEVLNETENISLGISSDRNLDYGYLPQGANSTKFVNISLKKKTLLSIGTEGNISEVLEYRPRMYFQGDKKMELEAKGREPGNYCGNITLKFEIPENQVGSYWLDIKYKAYQLL